MDEDTAKAISRSRHLCEQRRHERASTELVIKISRHAIRHSMRLIERTGRHVGGGFFVSTAL
ncbi:MAG TPA: hypothetical protein VKJ45_29160 [Blastocatellia bacterium]|nr:hypothetical protein [Blastocatellia bacterium]